MAPALRACQGDDPVALLTRCFLLQQEVAALPLLGLLADGQELGLLSVDGDRARARLDLRPYADDARDYYVVSDLTSAPGSRGRPLRPDHVVGVGGASTALAS